MTDDREPILIFDFRLPIHTQTFPLSSFVPPPKISAIEIAVCEPLAGRLPAQARTRVRAGGRPADCPPETISIVEFSSVVAGVRAH